MKEVSGELSGTGRDDSGSKRVLSSPFREDALEGDDNLASLSNDEDMGSTSLSKYFITSLDLVNSGGGLAEADCMGVAEPLLVSTKTREVTGVSIVRYGV